MLERISLSNYKFYHKMLTVITLYVTAIVFVIEQNVSSARNNYCIILVRFQYASIGKIGARAGKFFSSLVDGMTQVNDTRLGF